MRPTLRVGILARVPVSWVRAHVWRVASWLWLPAGVVLFSKTLVTPLLHDDILQHAMAVRAYPAPRGPFDLYDFVRATERADFVATGALPWWTADTLSIRFCRPLASAILFVEHRFVGSALAMHVHSLVWWALAVLAARALYRATLNERAATVATWIFAIAPCQVLPLASFAQREVLIATTLGVLGIRGMAKSGTARLLPAACFAGSFAAGEYGLCFGGYVLAWALAHEKTTRARGMALLPFAVPAALYVTLRAVLGYGTVGTGFYRDPVHAPLQFLSHAPRSMLVLWADAWTSLDASSWPLVCLVALALALLVAVRFIPKGDHVRWLALGSLLAAVPLVASAPGQRLTGPLLVGAAAALGTVIAAAMVTRPSAWGRVLVAAVVLVLHGGVAARSSWDESEAYLRVGQNAEARTISLLKHLSGRDDSTVIVALGGWQSAFLGKVWASTRAPQRSLPWHVLVTARHALMLRIDAHTIDVVVPTGQGFFPLGADDIFRAEDDPLHVGDTREVPGLRATVVADGTTAPPRIRFVFDRLVDDASFVWLSESRAEFKDAPPPTEGFGRPLSP